jgi:hypothetical protein
MTTEVEREHIPRNSSDILVSKLSSHWAQTRYRSKALC